MDGDERPPAGDALPADVEDGDLLSDAVDAVPVDAVPTDADEEEAAAIAVALSAYLAERDAEHESDEEEGTWHGRRWAFAGRMRGLTGRAVRIPTRAPTDDWTAADRADRL